MLSLEQRQRTFPLLQLYPCQHRIRNTALIVLDMWDRHWCPEAELRVDRLAPDLNAAIGRARSRGVVVIHAPGEVVHQYADHPARQRVDSITPFGPLPQDVFYRNLKEGEPLHLLFSLDYLQIHTPIDAGIPWRLQHSAIDIDDSDYISANGTEIDCILRQHKITTVLLTGVHTNVCLTRRPYGIRGLKQLGYKPVVVRDLTAALYCDDWVPGLKYDEAEDQIFTHIETWLCPTTDQKFIR